MISFFNAIVLSLGYSAFEFLFILVILNGIKKTQIPTLIFSISNPIRKAHTFLSSLNQLLALPCLSANASPNPTPHTLHPLSHQTHRAAVVEHIHQHGFSTSNTTVDVQPLGSLHLGFLFSEAEPLPQPTTSLRRAIALNTVVHGLQGRRHSPLMVIGLNFTAGDFIVQHIQW